ncbi:Inner membrane protein YdcO [compost metagenome]
MAQPDDREAALITFLVTASGMSFLGLSAAFWGLVFGIAAHLLLSVRRNSAAAAAPLHTASLAKEEATG